MSDPRLAPDPALVTAFDPARVGVPVTDLCRRPDGPRDRQLIFGEAVTLLGAQNGWSYVQAAKDGYCGHLRSRALAAPLQPTHRVIAAATHAYTDADFKSPDRCSFSFGSLVSVTGQTGKYANTDQGWVPIAHLAPVDECAADPASIAALFLGTPYLWGGNSRWGIDCSGLVQAALLACGTPCPGDSDMQMTLGAPADGSYRRNDLLFWKGHVALVTDGETLIHANGHSMSVAYENIAQAIDRIKSSGDGPVTAHRRL